MAIKPFAGELAGTLFAIGIMNAGFMGLVIVSLSTAYAFSEFFGTSGSLDYDFKTSKMFYMIFIGQLVVAGIIALIPSVSLFTLAVATQALNAMVLPLVFFFLHQTDKRSQDDARETKINRCSAISPSPAL